MTMLGDVLGCKLFCQQVKQVRLACGGAGRSGISGAAMDRWARSLSAGSECGDRCWGRENSCGGDLPCVLSGLHGSGLPGEMAS